MAGCLSVCRACRCVCSHDAHPLPISCEQWFGLETLDRSMDFARQQGNEARDHEKREYVFTNFLVCRHFWSDMKRTLPTLKKSARNCEVVQSGTSTMWRAPYLSCMARMINVSQCLRAFHSSVVCVGVPNTLNVLNLLHIHASLICKFGVALS